jgi:type I restriction enzyme S subunit
MRFTAYLKYKPSGIEWLGDVPEHWDVKRGRFCMSVNPRSSRLRTLRSGDEVSFVPMEAVGEYGGLELEQTRTIADVGAGYTEFDDGDVVVAKITPCFENGKGALAVGLVKGAAFGTTELHVLRPAIDPRAPVLVLRHHLPAGSAVRARARCTVPAARSACPRSSARTLACPCRQWGTSAAIAEFLDRETAKLDTLVAKKRTLIERLKERRIGAHLARGHPRPPARRRPRRRPRPAPQAQALRC